MFLTGKLKVQVNTECGLFLFELICSKILIFNSKTALLLSIAVSQEESHVSDYIYIYIYIGTQIKYVWWIKIKLKERVHKSARTKYQECNLLQDKLFPECLCPFWYTPPEQTEKSFKHLGSVIFLANAAYSSKSWKH